eukprot:Skav235742  [mRNA]  locus=scaffold1612:53200:56089:- [translate_table: standard]
MRGAFGDVAWTCQWSAFLIGTPRLPRAAAATNASALLEDILGPRRAKWVTFAMPGQTAAFQHPRARVTFRPRKLACVKAGFLATWQPQSREMSC